MFKYLAKRIGRSILTLFIIVTLVFCLLRLMPVEGYFANYEKMTEAQIQAGLQSMGLSTIRMPCIYASSCGASSSASTSARIAFLVFSRLPSSSHPAARAWPPPPRRRAMAQASTPLAARTLMR